ncbi:MAG: lipooligosaccharide transport system permease protein [Ilumatobacteraceae bacterium]|jgi:lipooligosaccharide transport system permease protein|nr:lipooligosaccharide transport system permease protein [Ilumatobacteraceae bacterium]
MAMATPGPVRVAFWHATVFRRLWVSNALASIVQPLLYLLGLGVGVGSLVDRTSRSTDVLGGVSYVSYISPALMVTTAMALAANESLWPIMGGFIWQRSYYGISATPLGPADIVGGHALWMAARCTVAASCVAVVLAFFPDARDWGLVPGVLVAALTGMAFAMPLMAFATRCKNDHAFPAMNRFVIIPLFLFGGAFYPLSQLPGWTQAIVKCLPLWHGVELARGFTIGHVGDWASAGHVAVLLCWILGGSVLSHAFMRRRLYV